MNLIVFIIPGCILLPFVTVFFILLWRYFKYRKRYQKLEKKLTVNKCIDLSVYTLTRKSFNKELGICAGEVYYHDVWTRDAFFASLGLLSSGIYPHVQTVLHTLSKYQRKDGLIPLRVGHKNYVTRFICNCDVDKVQPVYHDDKAFSTPSDSNSQFIILNWWFYQHTNDLDFFREMIPYCFLAFSYLIKNLNDELLLTGNYFDTWHDTVTVSQPSLFSNVLFLKAYQTILDMTDRIGKIDDNNDVEFNLMNESFLDTISELESKLEWVEFHKHRDAFHKHFWNGEFFTIYPGVNHFETAGNSLAMLFDFVDEFKCESISKYVEQNMSQDLVHCFVPLLPCNKIYKPMYLVCLQNYHNGHYWLWVNGLFVSALKYRGINPELQKRVQTQIEKIFCEYGCAYERISQKMEPTRHLFQSSEINFSESAGMFLLMQKIDSNFFQKECRMV